MVVRKIDHRRLLKLRVFELIYIIIVCLILIALLEGILWYYHASIIVLRMVVIIGLLFAIKAVTPANDWSVYKIIPWLRELKDYERERFKKTFRPHTSTKTSIIIHGVLVVITFVLPTEQDPRHMTLFLGDWLSIMCWLLIMVIVNWFVNKIKVDAEVGENIKGFTSLIYILGFLSILLCMYFRNSFEKLFIYFMS
ncbi:hypothetical protein [Paenibacillus spongiae]|uniref:DUF4181 domain-containing protein n=1 Tax=Paenibacillus spongiae TaxID=2909671 RepID=A0ABY5S1V8_9BACL|nr:hypothetical protein [Paenibacillus spongiae]UVI27428.1 hypothetical protein L1F29_18325 [Paenibacillus spongiae]